VLVIVGISVVYALCGEPWGIMRAAAAADQPSPGPASPLPAGPAGPAGAETGRLDQGVVVIKRIEIQGLRKIAETTVRGKLPLQEGDVFSVEIVRRMITEIFRLGYFEDVQVATEGFEGGLRLVVMVKEWPTVRDIRYEGYDQISVDKLKERVTIKPGSFLDFRTLTEAKRSLTTYYQDQGYFQATVVPLLQESKTAGEVSLTFVITEGRRARVRSVEFSGNHAVSNRQLRAIASTKAYFWLTSWLTDSGLYQKEVATQDVERIRDYYLDRGYLQVQVGAPQVTLSQDHRWFDVSFQMVEGDPYTIASVSFSGVELFTDAQVRAVMKTMPGMLFKRSQIRQDILAVTDLYGEHGYAFAQVVPQLKPDAATQRVAIEFQVQESHLIHVHRIEISGNLKTRDKVIRRELRVSEQGILDTTALRRSFQRLNNLNFFESVEIVPTPVQGQSDEVNLDVKVKEKPTGTFSVGGGYSSVDKVVGLVEITQGNLFGRGQLLRAQGQLGGRTSSYSLTFRDPYFLDYPVSSSVSVFNQQRDFSGYKEKRKGSDLVFGKSFTEYVSGSAGYSFQVLNIFSVSRDAPVLIKQQYGLSTTSALKFSLARDSRDVMLAPTRGSRNALSIDYAGTFLGGDNDYYKLVTDSTWYFPVWWETVVSAHGRFGYAHPTTVDGTLPVGERFFVGGIDTVRGFHFGKAGPKSGNDVIGGNKELIFNVEYLFPLVPEAKVRGVLFFDAGRGFDTGESIRFSALRTGAGVGIRLFLPIGPIRVEWGFNLSPKSGEPSNTIDFTIGSQF
jgi:outer membrane protein insertion porin family